MTKGEANRLRRYVCGWCGRTLYSIAKDGCHGYLEKCSQQLIADRQADCLSHYRPRKP